MIQNIILAYQNRISNLTGCQQKQKAIEKLNKITIKIGYPDQWKDYSKLEIKSVAEGGSYFENIKIFRDGVSKKDISLENQWIKPNGICLHKR
jgi:endothelin-converting enzyme/putative endopeptidase